MILVPPPHIGTIPNKVSSVNLWEGTQGEWLWAHHPFGSYVYGFKITNEKKTSPTRSASKPKSKPRG